MVQLETVRSYNSDRWLHLVVSADSIQTVIYIDGMVEVMGSGLSTISSTDLPTVVGTNNLLNLPFDGSVDDIRIYDRA